MGGRRGPSPRGGWQEGCQGFAIRAEVPPFVVTLGGCRYSVAPPFVSTGGPISGCDLDFVWWGPGAPVSRRFPVTAGDLLASRCRQIRVAITRTDERLRRRRQYRSGAAGGRQVRRWSPASTDPGFLSGLGSFVCARATESAEAVAGTARAAVIASVVNRRHSLFGGRNEFRHAWWGRS